MGPAALARCLAFAALLAVAALLPAQAAEKRVALVVGNGDYQHVPRLDNPAHDARLIGRTLADLGFTLIGGGAQIDLDRPAFERAVREFGRAIGPGTVALFYYSGHGLQVRGANYLVPVQANLTSLADVDFELLDVDVVVRQMDAAHSSLNLIILDACRNNPFGGRGLRDGTGGLAEMHAPRGTLISYATQPGGVARDGDPGGDSPYTLALAKSIRTPGIDVFKAFNQVGVQVSTETGGGQVPWLSSSPIDGEFYLAAAPAAAPPPPAAPAIPPPEAYPSSAAELDALFWHSIEATNRPEELQAYLRRFPNGVFADLARSRLALLQVPHPEPAPAPMAPPSPPAESPPVPVAPVIIPAPAPEQSIGPAQISEAQRLLAAMGLSRAPVTGRADRSLGDAIRIFERAAGQPETGVLSPAVLAALRGPPPLAVARGAALFSFAAEATRTGHPGDAIALYEMGLQLAPGNAEAQRALAELRRAREPPVRPVVQRPATPRSATPSDAPPRGRGGPAAEAPVSGSYIAVAVDANGRRFRAGGSSEGAAVSSALGACHASSGDCRIVSLSGG